MTFYNITWGIVHTICQSLIDCPLLRGYFGSLGCTLVADAVVERWMLERG